MRTLRQIADIAARGLLAAVGAIFVCGVFYLLWCAFDSYARMRGFA